MDASASPQPLDHSHRDAKHRRPQLHNLNVQVPTAPNHQCQLLQWLLPPLTDLLLFPFVAQQQLRARAHRPAGLPIPDPVAFGVDQSEGPDLWIGEARTPPVS